ncbi:MAG: hypothetical protein PHT44_02675 [Candidatus Portnoybacteria bacterium]|nr:hypothetical protein [Candidatus Portnoybacteria bacterium]MDD4982445.1 hypothetical protein [Candidatus Portnoybacteria bacterium]
MRIFDKIKELNKDSDAFSAKAILKFLGMGGVLLAAIAAPNAVSAFSFLLKDENYVSWKNFNRSSARRYVGRLEKRKLIKRKMRGGRAEMILTKKGREELLKYDVDRIELKNDKRWDGKWRVIIFDIPEDKKQARDALRSKFKNLRMLQLQKSVFIYPFDCKKEIDFISDFFGVGDDILYLESDIKDIDKRLKKYFNV